VRRFLPSRVARGSRGEGSGASAARELILISPGERAAHSRGFQVVPEARLEPATPCQRRTSRQQDQIRPGPEIARVSRVLTTRSPTETAFHRLFGGHGTWHGRHLRNRRGHSLLGCLNRSLRRVREVTSASASRKPGSQSEPVKTSASPEAQDAATAAGWDGRSPVSAMLNLIDSRWPTRSETTPGT
jgi:hypothetical protein